MPTDHTRQCVCRAHHRPWTDLSTCAMELHLSEFLDSHTCKEDTKYWTQLEIFIQTLPLSIITKHMEHYLLILVSVTVISSCFSSCRCAHPVTVCRVMNVDIVEVGGGNADQSRNLMKQMVAMQLSQKLFSRVNTQFYPVTQLYVCRSCTLAQKISLFQVTHDSQSPVQKVFADDLAQCFSFSLTQNSSVFRLPATEHR